MAFRIGTFAFSVVTSAALTSFVASASAAESFTWIDGIIGFASLWLFCLVTIAFTIDTIDETPIQILVRSLLRVPFFLLALLVGGICFFVLMLGLVEIGVEDFNLASSVAVLIVGRPALLFSALLVSRGSRGFGLHRIAISTVTSGDRFVDLYLWLLCGVSAALTWGPGRALLDSYPANTITGFFIALILDAVLIGLYVRLLSRIKTSSIT